MNVAFFIIVIALLGWASNIYVLATDSSLTIGEAVLHGVGIIVFPLGSLLGIISWFA